MNNEEKLKIWKRKVIKLENKVEKLNNHRNIIINLLNEAKTRQNIKLNSSLKGLNLEEEILHLKDWIEFHEKEISIYKNKINYLETEVPKQKILEQELEDLDKESKKIVEKEKELEQKKDFEEIPKIEIPVPEELEKEAKRIKEAEKEKKPTKIELKKEEKPEIKIKEKEEKSIGELWKKEEKPKIEIKEEETKKQIKELFEGPKGIKKLVRFKERLEAIKEPITNIFEATKLSNNKLIAYAVPIILLLLVTSVLFISKPEITGYVTLTREKTYDDNLNLIINESGNYTWTIDKTGDIESIKASGKVKGNGTVKIYIEKDGERYLIYDNKAAD